MVHVRYQDSVNELIEPLVVRSFFVVSLSRWILTLLLVNLGTTMADCRNILRCNVTWLDRALIQLDLKQYLESINQRLDVLPNDALQNIEPLEV